MLTALEVYHRKTDLSSNFGNFFKKTCTITPSFQKSQANYVIYFVNFII